MVFFSHTNTLEAADIFADFSPAALGRPAAGNGASAAGYRAPVLL